MLTRLLLFLGHSVGRCSGAYTLHSSTFQLNGSAFCGTCWGHWVVSVTTKTAQVEMKGGRVEGPAGGRRRRTGTCSVLCCTRGSGARAAGTHPRPRTHRWLRRWYHVPCNVPLVSDPNFSPLAKRARPGRRMRRVCARTPVHYTREEDAASVCVYTGTLHEGGGCGGCVRVHRYTTRASHRAKSPYGLQSGVAVQRCNPTFVAAAFADLRAGAYTRPLLSST